MAKTKQTTSSKDKMFDKISCEKATIKTNQSEAWFQQNGRVSKSNLPPTPETLKNKQTLPGRVKKYYMKCPWYKIFRTGKSIQTEIRGYQVPITA